MNEPLVKIDSPWWNDTDTAERELKSRAGAKPQDDASPNTAASAVEAARDIAVPRFTADNDLIQPRVSNSVRPTTHPSSTAASGSRPATKALPPLPATAVAFREPTSTATESTEAPRPAIAPAAQSPAAEPTRRVEVQPDGRLAGYRVSAVAIDARGRAVAIIVDNDDRRHTLREGSHLVVTDGDQSRTLAVRQISDGRVVMSDGTYTREIR